MPTTTPGKIYAIDTGRQQIAVRIMGLTPKVVRFHTDEQWTHGEDVVVVIMRPEEVQQEIITMEGYSID